MAANPNGAWYGRGLTSRVDRPLTIHKMASMIVYGQSVGGIAPSRWELSRELAEELAADAVTQWFMSGLSPSDVMKQIADGTLKICDVPIVLEKVMQAVTPGMWCDEDVDRLEAELRSKNLQILRLVKENERLRGVAEVALKAANPLYKVDAAPTKDDIIRGYELVCGGFGTIPKLKTTMSDPDVVMKNNLKPFLVQGFVQGHLSSGDDGPGALVRNSFGTFAEPDVAPSTPADSKPPIPLRALRTDRQTIGLREWK